MKLDGFLHLVKMYRENIVFRENNNGLISLSERAKLDSDIREMAKQLDLYGMKFRDMSCDDCANKNKCHTPKDADYKCFEYELT
jgi:hypothetical protein